MAYTPPSRHALLFNLNSSATPDRHALLFRLPPGAAVASGQGQSTTAVAGVAIGASVSTGQGQHVDASALTGAEGSVDTRQGQSVSAAGVVAILASAATAQGQSVAVLAGVAIATSAACAQGSQGVDAAGGPGVGGGTSTRQAQTVDAAAELLVAGGVATAQGQHVDAQLINFRRIYWKATQAALPWQQGTRADAELRLPLLDGTAADLSARIGSDDATAVNASTAVPWGLPLACDAERAIVLSAGDARQADARLGWNAAASHDHERALPWGEAGPVDSDDRRLPYHAAPAHDQERHLPWRVATPQAAQRRLPWERGTPALGDRNVRWGRGDAVPWVVPPYVPPQPPVPVPPACYQPPNRHFLRFALRPRGFPAYLPPSRHALALNLTCLPNRTYDVRSTLVIAHSLSVVRVSDNLPLKCTGAQISIDRSSWAWRATVTFADAASLIAIEPTPSGLQSIRITIDGYQWVLQVDGYSEDRVQGKRGGSVTATSASAQLSTPYAPQRAYINPDPTTAQQLVLNELAFTAFALDWRITDWPVPAGAYSYEQATPIDSIGKIAAAAGAMVQTSPDSATIVIEARTPDAPWNFDSLTPDFSLVGGSWLSMGKKWNAGARYNGVYVSGQAQGVLVDVHRAGTSGSPYAQLVVDPLILDTAPARARGLHVITDSLARHEIPIVLPMTASGAAPGLLLPGELGLIEDTVWGEYRAVVDALTVSFAVTDTGAITARQSATLWRYLP